MFTNNFLEANEEAKKSKQEMFDARVAQILQDEESQILAKWEQLKLGELNDKDFPLETFRHTTFTFEPAEEKKLQCSTTTTET